MVQKDRFNLSLLLFSPEVLTEVKFLKNWQDRQPEITSWEITTDEDLGQVRWQTIHSISELDEKIFDFLISVSADSSEKEVYRLAEQKLQAISGGTFLSFADGYMDAGWAFNLQTLLPSVLNVIRPTGEAAVLHKWAALYPSTRVTQVRRSIGAPFQSWELDMQLPNVELTKQMQMCFELFEAMNLEHIGEALTGFFEKRGVTTIGLVIAFTKNAPLRLGFKITEPHRNLMFDLMDLSDSHSDEKLAQLEGILETKSPASALYYLHADGWKTDFTYLLSATKKT
ncbi:MAG: hypothetical protein ACI85O_001134 [Saprospiraceae bacterium]|jgi:hypothetical protein